MKTINTYAGTFTSNEDGTIFTRELVNINGNRISRVYKWYPSGRDADGNLFGNNYRVYDVYDLHFKSIEEFDAFNRIVWDGALTSSFAAQNLICVRNRGCLDYVTEMNVGWALRKPRKGFVGHTHQMSLPKVDNK